MNVSTFSSYNFDHTPPTTTLERFIVKSSKINSGAVVIVVDYFLKELRS